nr:hypothetical protein GCM10025732_11740 [Glycomyces mayteni]
MALFIAELAFYGGDPVLAYEAKIGVLAASVLAALIGGIAVHFTAPRTPQEDDADPDREDAPVAGLGLSDCFSRATRP